MKISASPSPPPTPVDSGSMASQVSLSLETSVVTNQLQLVSLDSNSVGEVKRKVKRERNLEGSWGTKIRKMVAVWEAVPF